MKIEDIDREFKEIASTLKLAKADFIQGNYAEAEPLYKRALTLVERSYGENHSETLLCLQNLGECCFNLKKYKDAAVYFQRLLTAQPGKVSTDQSTILFKLAKCYEKQQLWQESAETYKKALAQAEQTVGKTHPLVATVLESFAGMLRRAQIRPKEASAMEESARDIRDSLAGPGNLTAELLGKLAESVSPGSEESAKMASFARTHENLGDSQRMRSLRSKSNERMGFRLTARSAHFSTTALFIVLGVLAVVVAGAAWTMKDYLTDPNAQSRNTQAFWTGIWDAVQKASNSSSAPKQAVKPANQSLSFKSADGLKELDIINDKDAVYILRGSSMRGTYTGDDRIMAFVPGAQSITYRFRKIASGLEDDEQTMLYASNAPETFIAQRMRFVARTAQRYYHQLGKYPDNVDAMLSGEPRLPYRNPITGGTSLPIRKRVKTAGDDTSLSGLSLSEYSNVQNTVQNMRMWTGETNPPCMIEFLHVPEGPEGDAFYVKGTDREGHWLKASYPGQAYVIMLARGG